MATTTHNFFTSVADMSAKVFQPLKINNRNKIDRATGGYRGADWYGIDGGVEAVKRTVGKTHEPMEKLMREFHAKLAAKIPRAVGVQRGIVRGMSGDALDYHAMLRGNHDKAWISSQRKLKRGHGIIRLTVDIGANCGTSSDVLQWRGVAGVSLAETLNKAGYSVEIVAGFAIKNHIVESYDDICTVCTVVKPRTAAINYGVLSSTIGLPGFFRLHGFYALAHDANNRDRTIENNFGNSVALASVLPVPEKVTQFIVPQDVTNEASAAKWVRETIELLKTIGE